MPRLQDMRWARLLDDAVSMAAQQGKLKIPAHLAVHKPSGVRRRHKQPAVPIKASA